MPGSKPSPVVPYFQVNEPTEAKAVFVYNSYDLEEAINEAPTDANVLEGGTKYQQMLSKYNDGNVSTHHAASLEAGIDSFLSKYNKVTFQSSPNDFITGAPDLLKKITSLNTDQLLDLGEVPISADELYLSNVDNIVHEDAFSSKEYLGFKTVNTGLLGQIRQVVSSSLTNVDESTQAFITATNIKIEQLQDYLLSEDSKADKEILSQLYGDGGEQFDSTYLNDVLSTIYEDTSTFLESTRKDIVIENNALLADQARFQDSSLSMTCKLQLFGSLIVAASQARQGLHAQQYQSPITSTDGISLAFMANEISNSAKSLSEYNDASFELQPTPLINPKTGKILSLKFPGLSKHEYSENMFHITYGFLVTKYRIEPDGSRVQTADSPIFLERNSRGFIDPRVQYGKTYLYNISTLVLSRVPAYDEGSKAYKFVYILLQSSNDSFASVKSVYTVPPPPPANIEAFLTQEVDGDKLTITWHSPLTRQDHIKGFQVFRRESINEPFELQRQIMFSNSKVNFNTNEVVDAHLIESPVDGDGKPMYRNFYIDNDFDIEKSYIYAIAAIDAHGLLSNYSEQVRLSFDTRKRVVKKELVSIQNAPRQMPNYLLKNKLMGLSTGDSGSRAMTICLDPDYLRLKFDGSHVDVFPKNAKYRLQLLNLDLQRVQNLNIVINETITKELMDAL